MKYFEVTPEDMVEVIDRINEAIAEQGDNGFYCRLLRDYIIPMVNEINDYNINPDGRVKLVSCICGNLLANLTHRLFKDSNSPVVHESLLKVVSTYMVEGFERLNEVE